ncbi:MAG TPA: MG2 domain-containing protein, partial [Pyrinomonadaceae bacterium]|nr:MG2 domain-containing protein [Pyrinomonadaceae bacterium]
MTRRNVLLTVASYAALLALVFGFAALRVKTQHSFATQSAPDELPQYERYVTPVPEDAKPFFSLVTNRTYGTGDRTRIWVNYRGLDSLDFRVYRVKDPVKFFRQLENPHQFGEDEEAKVGEQIKRRPTFLENLRAFKNRWYGAIKSYVRSQLQQNSRKSFNQKFRRDDEDDEANRTPLNVADYARVPLLNEGDMVKSWREKLPPLEDLYDRRMISLGRPEAGVYLVEAVHGDLRAFGVAVVSDLALVQKTTRAGDVLVYAVNRKSGAPREGVNVQVVEGEQNVTGGVTDKQGILRFKNPQKETKEATEEGEGGEGEEAAEDDAAAEGEDVPAEEVTQYTRLITATAGADFAISDLDSAYFGEYEGEEGGGENLMSYVYTDRPVYRPAQRIYFKGILRERAEGGYRLPKGTLSVTVDDPNGGRVYEQELTLSSRGTFAGELEVAEDAPLGSYNLTASIEGQTAASGYFEINEYKKPEYKVTVNVPQQYVNAGEVGKFNVSARYFFGAPVARADVKYYVYRSRYYGWWGDAGDEDEIDKQFGEDPTAEEGGSGSYGYYGNEVVQEAEGKLDEQGRLEVSFKVPDPNPKDNWDYTYRLEAEVTDPARRAMTGSASFVGVRGRTVASAHPDKYVYYQGDTARLTVRARDYDGRPVQTRVKLSFVERRWQKVSKRTEDGYEYPDYELKERELSSAAVETNAQGEGAYDYVVQAPGSIHIKTTVEENGRQITSEGGYLWAADRENRWVDVSYEGEETIKLVPDKKSYRPGETAHVLALLPTEGAHLLVTTELMSVMTVKEVSSTGRSVILDIPIEPRFAPNVYLNVTYVRNGELYTQEQVLAVPARDKLLNLEIIPNKKEFRPRETASYTLLARNADGSPAAGAEVSFGVVDEAVYQITPESVEDIRRAFYGRRYNEVSTSFSVNFHFTGYAGTKPIKLAANRKPN